MKTEGTILNTYVLFSFRFYYFTFLKVIQGVMVQTTLTLGHLYFYKSVWGKTNKGKGLKGFLQ